jgi:hypothetical protein
MLFFQLKNSFRRIGGFKGNPLLASFYKKGLFNVAIDQIRRFDPGRDKTAVI